MFNEGTERRRTRASLLEEIYQLRERNARLARSQSYGCLTRGGLEEVLADIPLDRVAAVFWDLDGLGRANATLGKEEVNRRVAESLQAFRGSDCVTGQVFSGDEFIAFPYREDAERFALRLLEALRRVGLSATFVVVVPQHGETHHMLMSRADELCASHKKLDQRGRVHIHL